MSARFTEQPLTEDWSLPLMQRLYRRSAIFDWRMRRPPRPVPTHWHARDPWRGNPAIGQPLVSGNHPIEHFGDDWHRFTWLRDMREYGGSQSRSIARRLVLDWTNRNSRWSALSWHPHTMAERLRMLVFLWGWFGESASLSQQQTIIAAMEIQLHCLSQDWDKIDEDNARIETLAALMIAALFLDPEADITPAANAFVESIPEMILGDGCHVSRRPDQHLRLLRVLVEIRTALSAAKGWGEGLTAAVADALSLAEDSIRRMGSVGRMWRHVDGSLMAIPGSAEIDLELADQVLGQAGPGGKITHHAADSGFIRIASGRSVLLMNSAAPSWGASKARDQGSPNDAGVLAIEFSNGQHRMIVNAGQPGADSKPELNEALASTAAHSTLSLDNFNAADISGETSRQAIGRDTETGPAEGGILAVSAHDGYDATHGMLHTRRVFLATGGNDLRGEDMLTYTGSPGVIPKQATIRFHLHPRITPILSIGGDVTLRLPGNAAPWGFRAKGGKISVEDSIFMGERGLERTKQITITADTTSIRQKGTQLIRWGLRRQQPHHRQPQRKAST